MVLPNKFGDFGHGATRLSIVFYISYTELNDDNIAGNIDSHIPAIHGISATIQYPVTHKTAVPTYHLDDIANEHRREKQAS
jgi:hypothetical protein